MLAEIFRFRFVDFGYDVAGSQSQAYRLQVLIGLDLLERNNLERTIKEPKKLP